MLVAELSVENDLNVINEAFLGLIEALNKEPGRSERAIVEAGGIDATLALMRQKPQFMPIQGLGCTILSATAKVSGDCVRAILQGGGVPLVVAAIDRHTEKELPRQQGIFTLRSLVESEYFDDTNVAVEVINVLLKVTMIPDIKSQPVACSILAHLSLRETQVGNCRAIVRARGIPALVTALQHSCRAARSQNRLVAEAQAGAALLVFGNVARSDSSSHAIIQDGGGIEAILKVMQTFETSQHVQAQACCVISLLPLEKYSTVIANTAGGVQLVAKALQLMVRCTSHCTGGVPRETIIAQKFVIAVLAGLSFDNFDNVTSIRGAGGVPAVIAVLQQTPRDQEEKRDVCHKAMHLLWVWIKAVSDHDSRAVSSLLSEFIDCQGIPAILACMEQMADASEIQATGCKLLAPLSDANVGNPSAVLAAGGKHVLKNAEERYKNNAEVQQMAGMALGYLKGCVPHCSSCNRASNGLMLCSRCKSVWYCGVDCQKKDYKYHKVACRGAVRQGSK